MKSKIIKSSNGFSLIELMVVVAIIGVLAAVSTTQYSKFQAKSRQSEAKFILASLYTAENSFQVAWNFYTVDLKAAGLAATGANLRYVAGFAATAACATGPTYNGPAEGITAADTWTDGANVVNGMATWTKPIAKIISGTATSCSQTSFNAAAIGDPRTDVTGTPTDQWNITEKKTLTNSFSNY